MLYPLLHWDTRFPAGYTGETVDLLMMDSRARTLRGDSEVRLNLDSTQNSVHSPIRNLVHANTYFQHPHRRHKVFEEELDDLRPRTYVSSEHTDKNFKPK